LRVYTQTEIDELIGCPKMITEPPKRDMKTEGGHRRNDMEVRSKDGKIRFTVFMRVNGRLPENFSIGLTYHPTDDATSVCLLRCNGRHGRHKNPTGDQSQLDGYHIHCATEEAMTAEVYPESHAELTTEYASYQQALAHFMKIANIGGAEKHFPEIGQGLLFSADEV